MAAPTIGTRTLPTGDKMPDGFSSKICFASKPGVQFWEETVKPSGIDGGDPINTTTMHNVAWETMRPQSLKKSDPIVIVAAYDPDVTPDIVTLINKEDTITQSWASGDKIAYYGYLQKAEFAELKKGEFPKVTLTIVITNWDPTANVEAGYTYQAAVGT